MTPRIAAELQGSGFDAVSIGVQSFQHRILRHLQRPTTAAVNRRAVALAREQFACVDVDLIFDVAYDGPLALLDDLEQAFAFGVDQVSTYPLMRFGYTPFGKARHERRAEHRLLRRASDLAASRGYHRTRSGPSPATARPGTPPLPGPTTWGSAPVPPLTPVTCSP